MFGWVSRSSTERSRRKRITIVRVVGQLLLEDLDRDGLAGLPGHGRLGSRGLPLAGPPDGARGAASERLLEQVLAAYRPHVMRSLVVVGPRVTGEPRTIRASAPL